MKAGPHALSPPPRRPQSLAAIPRTGVPARHVNACQEHPLQPDLARHRGGHRRAGTGPDEPLLRRGRPRVRASCPPVPHGVAGWVGFLRRRSAQGAASGIGGCGQDMARASSRAKRMCSAAYSGRKRLNVRCSIHPLSASSGPRAPAPSSVGKLVARTMQPMQFGISINRLAAQLGGGRIRRGPKKKYMISAVHPSRSLQSGIAARASGRLRAAGRAHMNASRFGRLRLPDRVADRMSLNRARLRAEPADHRPACISSSARSRRALAAGLSATIRRIARSCCSRSTGLRAVTWGTARYTAD